MCSAPTAASWRCERGGQMSIYAERARFIPVEQGFNQHQAPGARAAGLCRRDDTRLHRRGTDRLHTARPRRGAGHRLPGDNALHAGPLCSGAPSSTAPSPPAARSGRCCADAADCGGVRRRWTGARETSWRCRAASPGCLPASTGGRGTLGGDRRAGAGVRRPAPRGGRPCADRDHALPGGGYCRRAAAALRPVAGRGYARTRALHGQPAHRGPGAPAFPR